MRALSLLLLAVFVPVAAWAAAQAPLSKDLHFDAAATKASEPMTVLLTPEFSAVTAEHKVLWQRINFNIGDAVGANLLRALEANYRSVKVAKSLAEVKTAKWVEPKFYSFSGKLPRTSFGTYEAKLKVGFVLHDKKSEHEYLEDVTGTDKRDAAQVLFDVRWNWTGANSNETRLGLAANDAVKRAIDGFINASK